MVHSLFTIAAKLPNGRYIFKWQHMDLVPFLWEPLAFYGAIFFIIAYK